MSRSLVVNTCCGSGITVAVDTLFVIVRAQPEVVEEVVEQPESEDCSWYEDTQIICVQLTNPSVAVDVEHSGILSVGLFSSVFGLFSSSLSSPGFSGSSGIPGSSGGGTTGGAGNGRGTIGGIRCHPSVVLAETGIVPVVVGGM